MEVTLEADRVVWVGGAAEAEGHVRLEYGDQVLLGERATLRGDVVYIEVGRYSRSDGTLTFDVAEVGLAGEAARLEGVEATVGTATVRRR